MNLFIMYLTLYGCVVKINAIRNIGFYFQCKLPQRQTGK